MQSVHRRRMMRCRDSLRILCRCCWTMWLHTSRLERESASQLLKALVPRYLEGMEVLLVHATGSKRNTGCLSAN